ncbi:hypothetical protein GE21DRAFT_1341278, partial [Neurospora crassa]
KKTSSSLLSCGLACTAVIRVPQTLRGRLEDALSGLEMAYRLASGLFAVAYLPGYLLSSVSEEKRLIILLHASLCLTPSCAFLPLLSSPCSRLESLAVSRAHWSGNRLYVVAKQGQKREGKKHK